MTVLLQSEVDAIIAALDGAKALASALFADANARIVQAEAERDAMQAKLDAAKVTLAEVLASLG
jgi:hypothetical protein